MNIRMRHLLSVALAFCWFTLLFSPSPGEMLGGASLGNSADASLRVESLLSGDGSGGLLGGASSAASSSLSGNVSSGQSGTVSSGVSSGLEAGHDAIIPGDAAEYPFFIKPPSAETTAADRSESDLKAVSSPSSFAADHALPRQIGASSLRCGSDVRRALLCVYRL